MRPVLIPGNLVQRAVGAQRHAIGAGRRSNSSIAAGLCSRAVAGGGHRLGDGADRHRIARGQPYPRLYSALDGLLAAIEAAPTASGWGAALVRYELLLLAELGFGLDLDRCAVTGANDELVAVSPKSGRAVSAAEAAPYKGKLLPLPAFIREGGPRVMARHLDGLALTGHFLLRDLLTDRVARCSIARAGWSRRLRRAAGVA